MRTTTRLLPAMMILGAAILASAPTNARAQTSMELDAPTPGFVRADVQLQDDERPSRGPRIIAEVLVGGTLMTAGALGGAALGYALCNDTEGWFPCMGEAVLGGFVLGELGLISGVYVTGSLMDGNGSALWTSAGGGVGTLGGLGLAVALDDEAGMLALPIMALAGAVVGYELSSDASAENASAPAVTFALAPREDGVLFGASGAF